MKNYCPCFCGIRHQKTDNTEQQLAEQLNNTKEEMSVFSFSTVKTIILKISVNIMQFLS